MTSEEDLAWFQSTFRPIPKPELPDDAVEYSIYHISPSPAPTVIDEAAETRARLLEVQRTAADLTKDLLKDYIWQREAFRLEIKKEDGITCLQGRTNFGDSIEDEWVIVYILRELTKRHKDIWVKVMDGDGEFLLIEASGTIPAWIEPDVADNRVWIHQGDLRIIKPKRETQGQVTEKLSLPEARTILRDEPGRLLHSTIIQEEAFFRLRKYPQQISENLHSAIITIPRKAAFLLHQKPAYVSPAVEAFYVRDPIALRPLRSKDASNLVFKPDDLVDVSVRFTRVGFAQLKSQEFPVPNTWLGKLPSTDDRTAYDRAETGMKLACGLEMLLYDPQNQDKAAVREMKLLLEDVETGDEILPTDQDIQETWDKPDDDQKWLDINFEDLETELKGKGEGKKAAAGDFGDAGAQENLQRIVARFEEFLNDNSAGFDGADFVDDFNSDSDVDEDDDDDEEVDSDGEDKDASFNEDEFARMMEEMMGMPSSSDSIRKRVQELDSDGEDDTEEIKELSRRMEAELQGTGVLDLNGRQHKMSTGKAGTSKGKAAQTTNEDDEDDEDYEDDNININLAKNLLESLQSQAGASGPAGNMLAMMNMRMPKADRP